MKPHIPISPEALKAAHARVTKGEFYPVVGKDLGISKSTLRRKFQDAGLEHHVGKQRCAVFFPPKPPPKDRDRSLKKCKTWAHDLSNEMLRAKL